MSREFLNRNHQQNSGSENNSEQQKKIDPEAQRIWLNNSQLGAGWGEFNNLPAGRQGDQPAQMFVREEEKSQQNEPNIQMKQGEALRNDIESSIQARFGTPIIQRETEEETNENELKKANNSSEKVEYGEMIEITGKYWQNRIREAINNEDKDEAYRIALAALSADISEIESKYGTKEAERVKKEDWKGDHPAFLHISKSVPGKARVIKYGDGEAFFYPLPGFYPDTKSCESYLQCWGNTQGMINDFSIEVFGYGIDALLLGFDILTVPSGESIPLIAARKALWSYIKGIPKRMLVDASQQLVVQGLQYERIDWFDAAVSGVITYKVAQKPLKAIFDYRIEDKVLTIKTFDEARKDWRVRVITGVAFDKYGGGKAEIEKYILKTTEKAVRSQINETIDEVNN